MEQFPYKSYMTVLHIPVLGLDLLHVKIQDFQQTSLFCRFKSNQLSFCIYCSYEIPVDGGISEIMLSIISERILRWSEIS